MSAPSSLPHAGPSMPSSSTSRSPAGLPGSAPLKDTLPVASVEKDPQCASVAVELKNRDDDHPMSSPPPPLPPPPKLPEIPASPKIPATPPSAPAGQSPAQLALLLSNALSESDSLKRALADERRRSSRSERLLQSAFHLNDISVSQDHSKNAQVSEQALKAILDAEARADRAERARDDALHALYSLSNHFTELERYQSSLSLRAADARSAFNHLLNTFTARHPAPDSSPPLQGPLPAFNLPPLPPPLPAPSPSQHLSITVPPPPSSSIRYDRGVPHATSTFGNPSSLHSHGTNHVRQSSLNHGPLPFSSLPLPPPPSASGLGSGLIGALPTAPPSSSSSFSVPAKRSHRGRSARGLEDGTPESAAWEDTKRRRVGNWDMDIDDPHANQSEQPLPYPHHQPPLSAQPTQRVFEHDQPPHQQPFARNGGPYPPETNGNGPVNVNGMVRLDARELVRDAKERERREKGYHHRPKDGETGRRRNRRSTSRSSWGSSRSIDEMLLETATDGGRGRREDGRPIPHDQLNLGQVSSQGYLLSAGSALPPPPSVTRDQVPEKTNFHSRQPSAGSGSGTNSIIEKEKSVKVPATQLMTLGPGGVVVSGGGQAARAAIPGGGFPPYNEAGQRICRQCGVPGRYKDGKCVEKWGPGPEGPGTVCDKCRKKMKRIERRGTLDGATAAEQYESYLAQAHSQSRLLPQPMAPSYPSTHDQSRASWRSDTLVLDAKGDHSASNPQSRKGQKPSSPAGYDHAEAGERLRNRELDERSRGGSSRSHSPALLGPRHTPGQGRRRAPTPPHITSISTREQDGDQNVDEDAGEYERDGNGELDVDAELAHAADVANSRKSLSRSSAHYSSSSSLSSNVLHAGPPNGHSQPARSTSRASSSSYEHDESRKFSNNTPNDTLSLRRAPSTTIKIGPRVRRRDTQDELYEDDDDDHNADADGSGDPDADIMDAVDATMKVEGD